MNTQPGGDGRIRILITDDHGLVRAGLHALLRAEADMEVVGEAADGSQALSLASRLQPDVVLADLSMPPPDGIELARRLKAELPSCRTLIVTMHEDPHLVQNALAAGAAGYLIKRAVESELTSAIRTVVGGQVYVHQDLDQRRSERTAPAPPSSGGLAASDMGDIGEVEWTLLQLLANGATMQGVAEGLGVSVEQADSQRRATMDKLGLRGRVDVVRWVRRVNRRPGGDS